MSVAFVQSGNTQANSGASSPMTVLLGSNSRAGDTIAVGVNVTPSSGSTTAIAVSDNNGNTYTAVISLTGSKTGSFQVFLATNISIALHNPLTISVALTSSAGTVTWGGIILVQEFSGVASLNAAAKTGGQSVSVTLQPAGVAAVGFSLGANLGPANISGPPTWTLTQSVLGGATSAVRGSCAYSLNVAAGTQTYDDTNAASTVILTLNPSTFPSVQTISVGTKFLKPTIQGYVSGTSDPY